MVEEIYVDAENMINATAVSEFVQFNPDTREFTIQTDDNKYGDTIYEIKVKAENAEGISA